MNEQDRLNFVDLSMHVRNILGTDVRLAGGFQRPARRVAGGGEHPVRRVLGCAPSDRIAADRAAMLSLPPVAPATGWRSSAQLARDHCIRLDSNGYPVHPSVIGRRVEVIADLDRVRVLCDGTLAAGHNRLWARHQTVPGPGHVAAAKALRRDRISLVRPVAAPEAETRRLTGYDTALGLDGAGDIEGGVA